jgi:hypothetical protein
MILIDEFHMHCQHGMDFRREIKQVCHEFIRPLMKKPTSPYSCHLMASFQDFSFTAVQIKSSIHSNQSNSITNYKSLFVSLLWNSDFGIQLIYDRKKSATIKQYHVQALAMQLFTLGFFEFTDIDKDGNGFIRI